MSRKESLEPDRDSLEGSMPPSNGLGGQVPSISSTTPPPPYGGAFSVSQQFSFVDPSVMAMTNTAATIAAVAASVSALQQITQAKNSSLANSAAASVVAALGGRKPLLPSHQGHTSGNVGGVNPHVAALLGSAVGGGAQLQYPKPTASGLHASIHQALSPADTASALHHSAAAHASSLSNALLPNMQSWTLEQLEQHVNLLHQLNQPVPQSVALLLADAQRKEKKRNAKRVANRKSASTSRARKKALVEEMTKINARLKRQALILALLPDLVIAITTDGVITFCSDQVQKVLMHDINDLMGAKLGSLVAPGSRDALNSLIKSVVKSDNAMTSNQVPQPKERATTKRRRPNPRNSNDTAESKGTGENGKEAGNDSGRGSSRSTGGSGGDTSAAAVVSEQSFPLSVVEVESKRSAIGSTAVAGAETNENSDTSTSNGGKQQLSSLSNSATRSPMVSSLGEEDGGRGSRDSRRIGGSAAKKNPPSSDDSSSLSSEAKNMRKANDNLDRNVRWHNQRMLQDTKNGKSDFGPKDDVTGASVTANNASARLSSLKHNPYSPKSKDDKSLRYERNEDQSSSDDSLLAGVEEKKKTENVSDDSGYRESNDSREETSSSGSDTSNSNDRRKKKIASTCKICLIRQDLSTVWCEVTSSIRTRSSDEDLGTAEAEALEGNQSNSGHGEDTCAKEDVKELLLCLRPIRDGDKKVDEVYRFTPMKKSVEIDSNPKVEAHTGVVSSGGSGGYENDDKNKSEKASAESGATSHSGGTSRDNFAGVSGNKNPKRPPKKRPLSEQNDSMLDYAEGTESRKRGREDDSAHASDTEKSVVESLMLMNKSQ